MVANRFSKKPMYLRVLDELARRIASKEWKPGFAIPSECDVAREFGVSAGTARKALELLESERLITRRQGKGTFVNDQTLDQFGTRYDNLRAPDGGPICGEAISTEIRAGMANELECRRLLLQADEPVYRIHRDWQHNGHVYLVEDVSLPARLFTGLTERKRIGDSLIGLAQEYGILLSRAEERVWIGQSSAVVAQALGIGAGSPTMVLDRVVTSLDGRPIEWRVGCCNLGGKYYYAAELA
jgi:GntR family transcriptional regulator